MAITNTAHIHINGRDAGQINASELFSGHPCIHIGDDVTIFPGSGDDAALVLAGLRQACEDAMRLLTLTAPEPQPGAGAEYGMEVERG